MSDPPLSDIDFINKIDRVWTTLKPARFLILIVPCENFESFEDTWQKWRQ